MMLPRRAEVDKYTEAEAAIRFAILAVERVGRDVRLTDAGILLARAQNKVADFVDHVDSPSLASVAQRERSEMAAMHDMLTRSIDRENRLHDECVAHLGGQASLREACAHLLEEVTSEKDVGEIGERAVRAFNAGPPASMAERLRAWNAVLAEAIRKIPLTSTTKKEPTS